MSDQKKSSPQLKIQIDFADARLFGNDAADFEDMKAFLSYALVRDEIARCLDPTQAIAVARAYKGEGKSALLRLIQNKLEINTTHTVITTIGPDFSPDIASSSSDVWARAWKKSILQLIARHIGAGLGTAFSDDAISLVEEAESNGFKERSVLSSVLDRLRPPNAIGTRERPAINGYEQLIKRRADGRAPIWIIVDDIDQNFANNDRDRLKVAAFFTACRQLISNIPELKFRLCIRPNVWSIVKREYESLSHIEQYVFDLSWTDSQFRSLLAQRVASHINRLGQWDLVQPRLPTDPVKREAALVGMVFQEQMQFGGQTRIRPPHKVLHSLARHRPRWMIELCKKAGESAKKSGHDRILVTDIKSNLAQFGQRRVEDLVAEFRSMCPQIEEVVAGFSGQSDKFTTAELLTIVQKNIIAKLNSFEIVGVMGRPSDVQVAHFLFQIGFISARKDYGNDDFDHFFYPEKPFLLQSPTNLDDGCTWEIHVAFREVLNLRHFAGRPSRHN